MLPTDILGELKQTYLATFPAHLEEMENLVLALERGDDFQENYEALYRKTHSLKGSGGTYGFTIISSVCHQMEDYLTDALSKSDSFASETINTILSYIDILKETHGILRNHPDTTDFKSIEQQLKTIKNSTTQKELKGIFVGNTKKMYTKMCLAVFDEMNIACTTEPGGLHALQRLLHEHFDFLITHKETSELNGIALIAALKLSRSINADIDTILITSNPNFLKIEGAKPDHIVIKNASIDEQLTSVMDSIRIHKKNAA